MVALARAAAARYTAGMRTNFARIALLTVASLLTAACAGGMGGGADDAHEAASAAPVPVALRVELSGETAPILDEDGGGRIELLYEGSDEPIEFAFQNNVMTVAELIPGRYEIARLGPLFCRDIGFEIAPEARARALGTLRARIIETEYYVALIALDPAGAPTISEVAERTGGTAGAVDARPIRAAEQAPCFLGRGGPGMTYHDLPLGQKILVNIGLVGFCAAAVASGGFCIFGAGL